MAYKQHIYLTIFGGGAWHFLRGMYCIGMWQLLPQLITHAFRSLGGGYNWLGDMPISQIPKVMRVTAKSTVFFLPRLGFSQA